MNVDKTTKYNILFEHNLALKIAFDFGSQFIGEDYQVTFKDLDYIDNVEEIIVDPIDFRGADILVKTRFRTLDNRLELLRAGLGTQRLIDYLESRNQTNELFEQYGIIYSMVVPPMVEEIDDYINN